MKSEIVFTIAFFAFALTVSLYIAVALRQKKRFANHRIVRDFVDHLSEAMMERISRSVPSERERFLVVTERVKISDESILSESCSVFFGHEHMRLLRTGREKHLMAYAIAEQLKRRIIEERSAVDEIKGRRYRIKTKCQRVLNGSQKCFLVQVYYIIQNELYVQPERW